MRVSDDLEWRETTPGTWVLYSRLTGEPFEGLLIDPDDLEGDE